MSDSNPTSGGQPARAIAWKDTYRCIVEGKMFALTFPSLSEAQNFADLCNRKPRLADPTPSTQTITYNGRPFTQREWSDFVRGHLL